MLVAPGSPWCKRHTGFVVIEVVAGGRKVIERQGEQWRGVAGRIAAAAVNAARSAGCCCPVASTLQVTFKASLPAAAALSLKGDESAASTVVTYVERTRRFFDLLGVFRTS